MEAHRFEKLGVAPNKWIFLLIWRRKEKNSKCTCTCSAYCYCFGRKAQPSSRCVFVKTRITFALSFWQISFEQIAPAIDTTICAILSCSDMCTEINFQYKRAFIRDSASEMGINQLTFDLYPCFLCTIIEYYATN